MKTILIVDDDEDCNLILSTLLEEKYNVVSFFNWKEAEASLKQASPDLIILDISMPDIDGYQALKLIRANPLVKNIHVIALTAYAFGSHNEEFLKKGFDGCLGKPIEESHLFQLVNKLIR